MKYITLEKINKGCVQPNKYDSNKVVVKIPYPTTKWGFALISIDKKAIWSCKFDETLINVNIGKDNAYTEIKIHDGKKWITKSVQNKTLDRYVNSRNKNKFYETITATE